ncbi:RNA polymerase sigma factor [Nannocystaceae bacterium ST9]
MKASSSTQVTPVSEAAGFEAVYRTRREFVLRVLARHGVPEASREDAAQDVFVVVHRRWSDWQRGSIESWLYGITRRIAATNHRSARRREHYLRQVAIPTAPGIDDQLELDRNRRALALAIERLEGDQRSVFELAAEQERSGPEIADELGIGLNTVYSRLRLARERVIRAARELQISV